MLGNPQKAFGLVATMTTAVFGSVTLRSRASFNLPFIHRLVKRGWQNEKEVGFVL